MTERQTRWTSSSTEPVTSTSTDSPRSSVGSMVPMTNETTTSLPNAPSVPVPVCRTRGRRRILPPMTNSERARYYRLQHTQLTESVEAATSELRDQVLHLEIRLRVQRELMRRRLAPGPLQRIMEFVQHFVAVELPTKSHGLHQQRHQVTSVDLCGDRTAPVIRVVSELRGRLSTPIVHSIYPFVLGNTVVLDELIHQEVMYTCSYLFCFDDEGIVEHENVEIDLISALRHPLLNLTTTARVVSSVNIVPDVMDTPSRSTHSSS